MEWVGVALVGGAAIIAVRWTLESVRVENELGLLVLFVLLLIVVGVLAVVKGPLAK